MMLSVRVIVVLYFELFQSCAGRIMGYKNILSISLEHSANNSCSINVFVIQGWLLF